MEEDFKNNLFQSYRTAYKDLSKFAELESKHWENYNSEVREIYFDKKLEDLSLLENFRFDKSLSAGMDDVLVSTKGINRSLSKKFLKKNETIFSINRS